MDDVDWPARARQHAANHGLTVDSCTEAVTDPDRLVIDPDSKSETGKSFKIIGWSRQAAHHVTVVLIHEPDGGITAATAWPSSRQERRDYNTRNNTPEGE